MSLRTVPACMAALSVAVLAACTTPQERVQQHEDLLAAAGFVVRPVNTAARQEALAHLPPHHFVQRIHGDAVVYLYADPLVCNCLYIGSQEAYGRYRQERLQQRMLEQQQQIVDEQQMNADRIEDSGWDWGMWGPGFYR